MIYLKAKQAVPNFLLIFKFQAEDKFYLEQKEISIGELSQFAASGKFSNQIVSVNVSKKVPYESFVKVLDILKQGKIKKLNLGTE